MTNNRDEAVVAVHTGQVVMVDHDSGQVDLTWADEDGHACRAQYTGVHTITPGQGDTVEKGDVLGTGVRGEVVTSLLVDGLYVEQMWTAAAVEDSDGASGGDDEADSEGPNP